MTRFGKTHPIHGRRRLGLEALERRDLLAGELIELMLTARTDDDQLLPTDANGHVQVDLNEAFNLEISYSDLRLFNSKLGAFQVLADIAFSQNGAIEPILNEAQRINVSEQILQQSDGPGKLTFGIEESATTYVSTASEFTQDPKQQLINALTAFDYSPDQYDLTPLQFANDDIGFDIVFTDSAFADTDLPNISIATSDFTVPVPAVVKEFAPRNPDGTINAQTVRFNINNFSRTYNNNEQFYGVATVGTFASDSGFTDIGGVGGVPLNGGGIPQLTDDGQFINPFDVASLRVKFVEPVSSFIATVSKSSLREGILLYGQDSPVIDADVLIDEDASVTFNVGGTVAPMDFGDAPTSTQSGLPSSYPTRLEDDGARHVVSSTTYLGDSVDAEEDGTPSLQAVGDDETGGDEDGVVANSSIVAKTSTAAIASFEITTFGGGVLDAWIDVNRDGDWDDAGERVFSGVHVPDGTSVQSFVVPETAVPGETYGRFRLTNEGIDSPRGRAPDGEVEDLLLTIADGREAPDVMVAVVSGAVLEIEAGNIVVTSASGGVFRVPIDEIRTQSVVGSPQTDTVSLDFSSGTVVPSAGLEIDGGEGTDTLRVIGNGTNLDLSMEGNVRADSFEMIDLSGPGAANVTIDTAAVRSLGGEGPPPQFLLGESDMLTFRDAAIWRMSDPEQLGDSFFLTSTNQLTSEKLQASVTSAFQNLIIASDINNNGSVTANDALVVINEMANRFYSSEENSSTLDPRTISQWPGLYFDQNADNRISALDALRVINELARNDDPVEGEALTPLDTASQPSLNINAAGPSSEAAAQESHSAALPEFVTLAPFMPEQVKIADDGHHPSKDRAAAVDDLLADTKFVDCLVG